MVIIYSILFHIMSEIDDGLEVIYILYAAHGYNIYILFCYNIYILFCYNIYIYIILLYIYYYFVIRQTSWNVSGFFCGEEIATTTCTNV